MTAFARRDGGQTVVIVAATIAVLLGALALAVDWGYGLTQRRIEQNAADAAALGAARALATSTELVEGEVRYRLSQQAVYCVARTFADANRRSFGPSGASDALRVQIGDGRLRWTDIADPGCPWTGEGTAVPATTEYVRVVAGTTYPSLFASVVGRSDVAAEASARARIQGTAGGQYPVWPMVRHYDPEDFDVQCADRDCSELEPFTFWSSQGKEDNKNMVFGSFKGLVDYSRYSPRLLAQSRSRLVDQLIESWDQRWTAPRGLQADESAKCPSGWDTAGDEDPNNQDKRCSIPNWTFYAFGGSLALDSDWSSDTSKAKKKDQEPPSDIGDRSKTVCDPKTMPQALGLQAPSCDDPKLGDWVETAPNGDLGNNVSAQMLEYIDAHGHRTALSDQPVPGTNGKVLYGRAVVIDVYLWDCAESFRSNGDPGDQWDLELPNKGKDCSQISDGSGVHVDRVHLFTAAPFTFYEGLVSTSKIQGFWGGAFGDPRWCESHADQCGAPNAFSNTAYLVPDD